MPTRPKRCCHWPPIWPAGSASPSSTIPRKIQRTTRDAVAELLPGIPGCRIPKVLRLKPATDCSDGGAAGATAVFAFRFWPGRPAPMAATILKRSKMSPSSQAFWRSVPTSITIDRIYRLSLSRRLFPQIPLHFRRRSRSCPIISRSERLEGASRHYRHGQSALDAAGRRGVSERSRRGLRCLRIIRRCARSATHRA